MKKAQNKQYQNKNKKTRHIKLKTTFHPLLPLNFHLTTAIQDLHSDVTAFASS